MRRFSSLVKASTSSSSSRTEFSVAPPITSEDHKIPAATVPDDEALPVPSLQVKRVDLYFSRWSRSWTYRNMSSKVAVEVISSLQSGNSDPWKDYSFVLVRKIPKMENQEPTFKIVIKSGYILKACQDVVQTWPGISWNAEPVEVDPEMFIAFFDKFIEYRDGLVSKNLKAERDIHMISSVNLLLSSISSDYRTTLSTINRLTSHGEITFELLYALLVPRTLFVATCAITGNTRLFKLVSATRTTIDGMAGYQIQCESYDIVNRSNQTAGIGKVLDTIFLGSFKGATKIQSLDAYPLKYHPDPDKLRATLLKRGTLVQSIITNRDSSDNELTDEDLILTSTVVYGFSLSDKMWFEFDVEEVRPVEWNEDAFANLVLPSDRKDLLRSLVEAHHRELGFDDFIKGKGHGLVINLFGPPGVGKTFSAEATSEHVKRPLYIVGGGDLGTKAANMDTALERIFDVATAWKAIVLIDEADVFLEQRSLHDLERNAMVAVFLRHVEYYRGILFLTTNRVQAFDEAFLSRIHVALHFYELSQTSKEQVWTAFIGKLRVSHSVTQEQIKELATRNINGRQIKNAVRTAQSLAIGRGETIEYRHFVETLDAMDEFTKEFEVVTRK
ncbi:hypothetical protein C0989_001714 [Termitomyces sp. Mn162]|nr:hypothetical protein C0989_001714 [Termitomyces sp. Mn162]